MSDSREDRLVLFWNLGYSGEPDSLARIAQSKKVTKVQYPDIPAVRLGSPLCCVPYLPDLQRVPGKTVVLFKFVSVFCCTKIRVEECLYDLVHTAVLNR